MPESGEQRRPLQKRWLVLGIIILLALVFLIPFIQEGGARVDTSVEVETETAFTGSVRETSGGRGEIVNADSLPVETQYAGRLAMVAVHDGDFVAAGDLLALYDADELDRQIDGILNEIDELDALISQTDQGSAYELRAETDGLVKAVDVRRGDRTGDRELMLLSTDGQMKVVFTPTQEAELTEGDAVLIRLENGEEDGTVCSVDEETGAVTVTFADQGDYLPSVEAVVFDEAETELGRGLTEINSPSAVTLDTAGIVSQVAVAVGDRVEEGDLLLSCIDAERNDAYLALLDQRAERIDTLFDLQAFKEEPRLVAETGGIVSGLEVESGDEIEAGARLCRLVSTDTFTLRVDVPEADARRVREGQTVELTFTGSSGQTYEGQVERLYENSEFKNGMTVRGIVVHLEDAEGLQVGMAADAAVILDEAEGAVLVPLRAVQTGEDGSQTVVLYYGDGLTRSHSVETGLQDGEYVQILHGVESGDNVVVASRVVETTVYSIFNHEWVVDQEAGPSEDGFVSDTDGTPEPELNTD